MLFDYLQQNDMAHNACLCVCVCVSKHCMKNSTNSGHCVIYKQTNKKKKRKKNKNKNEKKSLKFTECRCSTCLLLVLLLFLLHILQYTKYVFPKRGEDDVCARAS